MLRWEHAGFAVSSQFAPGSRKNHPIKQNQIDPVPDNKFPGVYACADERALQSCRIEIRANAFRDDNIVGNQQKRVGDAFGTSIALCAAEM